MQSADVHAEARRWNAEKHLHSTVLSVICLCLYETVLFVTGWLGAPRAISFNFLSRISAQYDMMSLLYHSGRVAAGGGGGRGGGRGVKN